MQQRSHDPIDPSTPPLNAYQAGTGGQSAAGDGSDAGEGGVAGTMQPTAGMGGGSGEDMPVAGAGEAGSGSGGVGGSAGTEAGGAGGVGGTGTGVDAFPDLRGTCVDFDTGFPGDEACIPPPPEGEGFQIHVGPEDYANPGPFLVGAQEENSICFSFRTPNTEEVFYNGFVLSARPGTHHIINTMFVSTQQIAVGEFESCLNLGTSSSPNILGLLPGASKPYMPRYPVAPENAGVGRLIAAEAPVQADLHYFNPTDEPLLREFWLNVYVMPASQVTERAKLIRGMGGVNWWWDPIPAGTDRIYQYQCPIGSAGRILGMHGHYHSHGERFTAFLKRSSGEQIKVFEMYDYNSPAEFNYDSIAENTDFSSMNAGAVSGMLDVAEGDTLQWECHIVNDSSSPLRYVNEVVTGEMCNIWGSAVGPSIDCVHDDPQNTEQPFEVTAQ